MLKYYNTKNSSFTTPPSGDGGLFCFLFLAFCFLPTALQAQCAMCRASLESEGNLEKAEAVNDGIVYLMAIPYIIVVVIAFVVYKMYKKKKDA